MTFCKICASETLKIFENRILGKYDVSYYQCSECHFTQTENPYWLDEAYTNPIDITDTGILRRNLILHTKTMYVIEKNFNTNGKFLEFGGGYGILTRLMRDEGFDFYFQDKYSESLFAKTFDLKNRPNEQKQKFTLITAFSLLEHLTDPISELRALMERTDNLLFNQELLSIPTNPEWSFLMPDCGQHISFYTLESLKKMSEQIGCYFYSDGIDFHLFSRNKIQDKVYLSSSNSIQSILNRFKVYFQRRKRIHSNKSFIQSDHELSKRIQQDALRKDSIK